MSKYRILKRDELLEEGDEFRVGGEKPFDPRWEEWKPGSCASYGRYPARVSEYPASVVFRRCVRDTGREPRTRGEKADWYHFSECSDASVAYLAAEDAFEDYLVADGHPRESTPSPVWMQNSEIYNYEALRVRREATDWLREKVAKICALENANGGISTTASAVHRRELVFCGYLKEWHDGFESILDTGRPPADPHLMHRASLKASFVEAPGSTMKAEPPKRLTILGPDLSGDDVCADAAPAFRPWKDR